MRDAAGALLALWNDVAPEMDKVYHDWHADEHVPERLTVPGMCWGRRYAALDGTPGPRYLTLYGLRDAGVLESDAYRRLLSHPTPASARMRPHLRNLSRWVCALRSLTAVPGDVDLAVRTFDAGNAAQSWLQEAADHAGPGLLLAERLSDAAPLPWLQSGQEQAIRGNWLAALALRGEPPPSLRGALLYRALPVSAASRRP
jgi:hypothetical protein